MNEAAAAAAEHSQCSPGGKLELEIPFSKLKTNEGKEVSRFELKKQQPFWKHILFILGLEISSFPPVSPLFFCFFFSVPPMFKFGHNDLCALKLEIHTFPL